MPRSRRSTIVPDDLARLHLPAQPRISPDGRRVVFVDKHMNLQRNDYDQNLWTIDLRTGTPAALTRGEHGDSAPAWTPDSRAVVFVSNRGGHDNVWMVAVNGGAEPQRLTDLDGRVRAPKVSPDGRRIAFLYAPRSARQRVLQSKNGASGPQYRHFTTLRYKQDGVGYKDDSWMHLWVLDLPTRRARQITFGDYDDGQHAWSPDGRHLAFVSNRIPRADVHFTNSDIHLVPARGGRVRRLTQDKGPKQSPSWSPDGRSIAFVGHKSWPDTVENMHVWTVRVRDGAAFDLMQESDLTCDNLLLADTKEHAEGEAPPPVWSARGDRLFYLASRAGETNVWEIDAARGGAPHQRSFGQHEITELSQSADGSQWAFLRLTPTNPGDVYVAGASAVSPATQRGAESALVPGARVRQLTQLNRRALARKQLTAPVEFRLPTGRGHEVHGWMLRAPGRGRGPAVLMVHGGPYAMYGWSFFHELQMLASHGYHVFFANIRGSAGYGRDFMRAIVGKWGIRDYEDVMRVADMIEAQPFVDRERIAIAGGSYGGYMTNWTIGHTRRFKCAISMRAVNDFVSMFGTSDIGWDLSNEFDDHWPWESIDRYWRVSPLAHVGNVRTPLLILHSDEDHRCPVSQAEEMFTALRLLGRDVEMVRFVGESHGLSRGGRPHNRLERLRRILDWFERKL